jgi:anthranilate/para-aminobenzoate synthase component I
MQIIEELEPVSRGPYTGCMGYIGFNRESQLNILIRTAIVSDGQVHFHAGSGIVADSDPEAEFEETNVKTRAFFQTIRRTAPRSTPSATRQSALGAND